MEPVACSVRTEYSWRLAEATVGSQAVQVEPTRARLSRPEVSHRSWFKSFILSNRLFIARLSRPSQTPMGWGRRPSLRRIILEAHTSFNEKLETILFLLQWLK